MISIDFEAPPRWAAGLRSMTRLKLKTAHCKGCGRSLTLRYLSDRKAGILLGEAWYCSSVCFSTAAEAKFALELVPAQVRAPHLPRMPLALILISRGWLTNQQVQLAMNLHKHTGAEMGEVLLWLGVVDERQITAARATQWGYPVFTVPDGLVRMPVHIPTALCRLYSMIPLHCVPARKRLLVGFVEGVEYGPLYTIEQLTGYSTKPCFITPSAFQKQMEQQSRMKEQGPQGDELRASEQHFEGLQTPMEMARVLCRQAVDIEADQAIIGKCRDYLWARLSNATSVVDVLFKTS